MWICIKKVEFPLKTLHEPTVWMTWAWVAGIMWARVGGSVSDCSALHHKGALHRCFCRVRWGESIFLQPVSRSLSMSVLFSLRLLAARCHMMLFFYLLFSSLFPLSTECKHRMKGFDCLNLFASLYFFPRSPICFRPSAQGCSVTPDLILKFGVNSWFVH